MFSIMHQLPWNHHDCAPFRSVFPRCTSGCNHSPESTWIRLNQAGHCRCLGFSTIPAYKTAEFLLICSAEIFNLGEIWAMMLQILLNLPRLLTFSAFVLTLPGSAAENKRAVFCEFAKNIV